MLRHSRSPRSPLGFAAHQRTIEVGAQSQLRHGKAGAACTITGLRFVFLLKEPGRRVPSQDGCTDRPFKTVASHVRIFCKCLATCWRKTVLGLQRTEHRLQGVVLFVEFSSALPKTQRLWGLWI